MNNELKEYIENRVNEFKENLINEIKEKVEKEKNKSIWDLNIKHREIYYAIGSNGGIYKIPFNEIYDENVRLMGNAFLTQEEAEFELERRKIETIMRRHSRPFRADKNNFALTYNTAQNCIYISTRTFFNDSIPFFESEEIAQRIIDEIGEERLKKYWFRAEE